MLSASLMTVPMPKESQNNTTQNPFPAQESLFKTTPSEQTAQNPHAFRKERLKRLSTTTKLITVQVIMITVPDIGENPTIVIVAEVIVTLLRSHTAMEIQSRNLTEIDLAANNTTTMSGKILLTLSL